MVSYIVVINLNLILFLLNPKLLLKFYRGRKLGTKRIFDICGLIVVQCGALIVYLAVNMKHRSK